jgi:amidohydrolase
MEKALTETLLNIRRTLHQYPEVSGEEYGTQQRILEFLSSHTNAHCSTVAKTGVTALFDSEIEGPTILIRGDIDALPIQETNTFGHKSEAEGVSHKCGHDGHTTILLGLALELNNHPIDNGKVLLLFQPAEETGEGAQQVMSDAFFHNIQIDFCFALHNLPGYEKHQIIIKNGSFTSNVKSIIIKLKGKTAHAAEPEHGYNPASTIANILQFADKLTKNDPKAEDFFLATPIHVNLGGKNYGISAGNGEVHLTLRTWSPKLMEKHCDALENYVHQQCKKEQLSAQISYAQVFKSNCNHPEAVTSIKNAATQNDFTIIEITEPFKWGEDFGLFTQNFKGAMFGLGAGKETPALHNPDYDFPDDLIATGIRMFHTIIQNL